MVVKGSNMLKVGGLMVLAATTAFSQTLRKPAAREHVRELTPGQFTKFTSKLATIVELNFTMNNGHQPGKQIISAGLTRIATNYGGLKVTKFTTANDGSARGQVPAFTIADLLAGEVIVSNNISAMGDAAVGAAKQSAIQTAIETNGKGYLAFHGSGDNQTNGWAWFTNTLHPMSYQGHENRSNAPVYKHLATAKHIIMDSILLSKVTNANVPNEIDVSGNEVLTTTPVPMRPMKNEWYRFGRDISRDATFKDKVTILLKYDPRALGDAELDAQYKRKGGNMFTYLYKVGAGMTSYMPPGHENDELLDANSGFDGGVGDYDRYVAQSLFFLAGYTQTPCDNSCNGLWITDANALLTGKKYDGSTSSKPGRAVAINPEVKFHATRIGFTTTFDERYEASVTDLHGRVLDRKSGSGEATYEFGKTDLKPGVYFLNVRVGSSQVKSRRYAIFPNSL